MTLVELMVGLVIGLFVVAVMGSVYIGSRTTFAAQESTGRVQENGRFAMDAISQDLRMSGFRGCLGQSAVVNTLNTPNAALYDFGQPVWGSRSTSGAWSPALDAVIGGLSPSADGDVLVVRRPAGVAWALIGEMASTSAVLSITPTANFVQGDLLMVADCVGAAVLQATNAAPGTGGSIDHQPAVAGVVPGVSTANLGRAFANDARVWRMQTEVYYLAGSARHTGQTALWVYRNPTYGEAQKTELVTGVERMAFTFGLDTDGDLSADRFASADGVANWAQVVSARVELLLVGNLETRTTKAQPYTFNGSTTTPTDGRPRTVMSTLVTLRNALP
ncbi:PilW family protein [Ideonella sp. DXS22W]|uniref:PilW family protein n=1 Tax=Pseudaquabacterium inlustre TaxID=2984192 RepID=A0ABU9CFX8_9BURK